MGRERGDWEGMQGRGADVAATVPVAATSPTMKNDTELHLQSRIGVSQDVVAETPLQITSPRCFNHDAGLAKRMESPACFGCFHVGILLGKQTNAVDVFNGHSKTR